MTDYMFHILLVFSLSLWAGLPLSAQIGEYRVTNMSQFVHTSTNVLRQANGTLEPYPLRLRDERLVQTIDFERENGRNISTRSVQDSHVATSGFRGAGLQQTLLGPPIYQEIPSFLLAEQRSVMGWRLEFFFYPQQISEASTLLSSERLIYREAQGKPYLEEWRMHLNQGRIVTTMKNLFHFTQYRLPPLELRSPALVKLREWNHFTLEYHPATGELKQFLNGEFAGRSVTEISVPSLQQGLYQFRMAPPMNHGEARFRLGENFSGTIDEIALYALAPHKEEASVLLDNKPGQGVNFFISEWSTPVFELEPLREIKAVNLEGWNVDMHAVSVILCASPNYFQAQNTPKNRNAPPAMPARPLPAPISCMPINTTANTANITANIDPVESVEMTESVMSDYRYYQLFFTLKNRGFPYARITGWTLTYMRDVPPLPPVITAVTPLQEAVRIQFLTDLTPDILGYVLWLQAEGETEVKKMKISLDELRATQRHPYYYHYILPGLISGTTYTLELSAYDRLIPSLSAKPKERSSIEPARVTFRTPPL